MLIEDLIYIMPEVAEFADQDGKSITRFFNAECNDGLEVSYLGDSFWEFEDVNAAGEALAQLGMKNIPAGWLEKEAA